MLQVKWHFLIALGFLACHLCHCTLLEFLCLNYAFSATPALGEGKDWVCLAMAHLGSIIAFNIFLSFILYGLIICQDQTLVSYSSVPVAFPKTLTVHGLLFSVFFSYPQQHAFENTLYRECNSQCQDTTPKVLCKIAISLVQPFPQG